MNFGNIPVPLAILGIIAAIVVGVFAVVFLLVPMVKGIGWMIARVFRFIGGEITDVLRVVGSIVTGLFFAFLSVANIVIGRWSASAHFAGGLRDEMKNIVAALYRVAIGHPARLLCLTGLTEGLEKRLPAMVAAAPGADKPPARVGQFEGYRIVGSLPTGGSGAKLYIAEPDAIKAAALAREGISVGQVVIKSFSAADGSSLPQIVRESRSLEAAKRLGLILDHELTDQRFYYVMRYVPGQSLSLVTKQLHAQCGGQGLTGEALRRGVGYVGDLLATLDHYHRGGLWHKDVKPDNIIVDGQCAHLVDFGLVTPLRSAMTLTTHGTEYFRDPEMVRLALKGAKVLDVDGTKFDIYGAGAVLYSVLEDSFPAHGVLSPITKRCPEALRWVVRRAMTEYDKRYATVSAMLADVKTVLEAGDPYALRPADLPSMRGEAPESVRVEEFARAAAVGVPPPLPREEAAVGAGAANANGAKSPAQEIAGAAAVIAGASVRMAQDALRAAGIGVGQGATPAGAVGAAVVGGGVGRGGGGGAGRKRPGVRVVNWWTGQSASDAAGEGDAGAGGAGTIPPPIPTPSAMFAGIKFGAARRGGPRAKAHEQLTHARERARAARERAHARIAARVPRTKHYSNAPRWATALAITLVAGSVVGGSSILKAIRRNAAAPSAISWSMGGPMSVAAARSGHGTGATAGVVPHPEPVEGRLLLVSDLLPPLSGEADAEVRRIVESLGARGFDVMGSLVGERAGADAAAETELLASVRAAVGTTALDTPQAATLLQGWLDDHSDDVDVIVWIEAGAKPGDAPRVRAFSALDKASVKLVGAAVETIRGR